MEDVWVVKLEEEKRVAPWVVEKQKFLAEDVDRWA